MPDITEPDVTSFVNAKIRPSCDFLVGFAQDIDVMTEEWTSVVNPAMSGDANGDLIFDGSETDGRAQLTKGELTTVATALAAVRAAITPAILAVLIKAHVNVKHLPGI